MQDDKNRAHWQSSLYAGLQLALTVLIFFLIGFWADKRWHTIPWFALVGFGMGLAIGLTNFIKLFKNG
jgi:F0F1-type ATP synthase assembly protein I